MHFSSEAANAKARLTLRSALEWIPVTILQLTMFTSLRNLLIITVKQALIPDKCKEDSTLHMVIKTPKVI